MNESGVEASLEAKGVGVVGSRWRWSTVSSSYTRSGKWQIILNNIQSSKRLKIQCRQNQVSARKCRKGRFHSWCRTFSVGEPTQKARATTGAVSFLGLEATLPPSRSFRHNGLRVPSKQTLYVLQQLSDSWLLCFRLFWSRKQGKMGGFLIPFLIIWRSKDLRKTSLV